MKDASIRPQFMFTNEFKDVSASTLMPTVAPLHEKDICVPRESRYGHIVWIAENKNWTICFLTMNNARLLRDVINNSSKDSVENNFVIYDNILELVKSKPDFSEIMHDLLFKDTSDVYEDTIIELDTSKELHKSRDRYVTPIHPMSFSEVFTDSIFSDDEYTKHMHPRYLLIEPISNNTLFEVEVSCTVSKKKAKQILNNVLRIRTIIPASNVKCITI